MLVCRQSHTQAQFRTLSLVHTHSLFPVSSVALTNSLTITVGEKKIKTKFLELLAKVTSTNQSLNNGYVRKQHEV